MKNWNIANIASQKGKTFLITGANSGTGFGAARTLAQKGGMAVWNYWGMGSSSIFTTS